MNKGLLISELSIRELSIRELLYEEIPTAYEDFILPFFPADEVKPLRAILKMHRERSYRVYALEAEPGQIAGAAFVTFHPGGKMVLLDYLAILPEMRARGLGSEMLTRISKEMLPGIPIMIETEVVELSEDEQQRGERMRRNAFYEKNGVKMTDLVTCIFGVYYNIWVLGEVKGLSVTKEMENCYRYMVSEYGYEENCKIPSELPLQTNRSLI